MNPFELISDALVTRGFCVVDDWLPPSSYQPLTTLLKTRHEQGQFRPARIGSLQSATHQNAIRRDHTYWLDREHDSEAPVQAYFRAIDELKIALNRMLFLGLHDFESHFATYEPGAFYKKHRDQFETTQTRRVSCVYYLNDGWQPNAGGELAIYDDKGELLEQIAPIGNRLVCFMSHLVHEVFVTHRLRYSITGWLKVRASEFAVL